MIVWEMALAGSALVLLGKSFSYRGGRINKFDCTYNQSKSSYNSNISCVSCNNTKNARNKELWKKIEMKWKEYLHHKQQVKTEEHINK